MPSSPGPSSGAEGPSVHLSSGDVLWIFLISVVAIVLLILVPLVLDTWKAYQSHDKAVAGLLPKDEAASEVLAQDLLASPPGIEGLGRMVLAIAVISIIGLGLIFLVLVDGSTGLEIAKTVLTALTGALATIVGFYFGSRSGKSDGGAAAPGGGEVGGVGGT